MRLVVEVGEAQVALQLERLHQLLGFEVGAVKVLLEGVAHQRLAAHVARQKVTAEAAAQCVGQLRQVDFLDGELHCLERVHQPYRRSYSARSWARQWCAWPAPTRAGGRRAKRSCGWPR